MTRHFIYPYLPLPYALQILSAADRITLRSFRLSGGYLNGAKVIPQAEAAALLAQPVAPFVIGRATPDGSWLPRASLGPHWAGGPAAASNAGSHVQEISQTALVLDPGILGSGALSERAEWVVPCGNDGRLGMPVNRTLLTWQARAHKTVVYQDRQQCSALTAMLPFADADFSRAILYAKMNPACGLVHDFPAPKVVSPDGIALDGLDTIAAGDWAWPRLHLSGPAQLAAGAFADYTISLHDGSSGFALDESGMRVELEASIGYLAHRIVQLQQGMAIVALGALGLKPGDSVKLKAGWRYFPGLAEKEIAIV